MEVVIIDNKIAIPSMVSLMQQGPESIKWYG